MSLMKVLEKLDVNVITKENEAKFKTKEWIDTGNYVLNAIISGDPFKGIPNNRIIQFAGIASTGKSFLVQEIAINAQKQGYTVIYFDSEGAYDFESLVKRGFDEEKLIYIPVGTVEELRKVMVNIVKEVSEDEKVLLLVDSLGNLATEKEVEDALSGKEKEDMTRARRLKSLFRLVATDAAIKGIPILLVNHVYTSINSFIPQNITSGGSGQLYNSSVILELTKAKDKESSGKQIGVIITAKILKSRFVKEGVKAKLTINFKKGLNRYSGILDVALEAGLIQKSGRSIISPNGEKVSKQKLTKEFFEQFLKDYLYEYFENEWKLKVERDENLVTEEVEDGEAEEVQ